MFDFELTKQGTDLLLTPETRDAHHFVHAHPDLAVDSKTLQVPLNRWLAVARDLDQAGLGVEFVSRSTNHTCWCS